MARQRVAQQVNQFVGGINTEANPLNFPPNASIDESNLEINQNGTRSRRSGFDVEENYNLNELPFNFQEELGLARNQFRWLNVGGVSDQEFVVVQIGNYLAVHDLNTLPISSAPLYTNVFSSSTKATQYGLDVVDGILVIATGEKNIYVLTYTDGVFQLTTKNLLVRDLFGVTADTNATDLTQSQNISVRPTALSDRHLYNLRNQTFGPPRPTALANVVALADPISEFFTTGAVYPSNADNINAFVFANANVSSDRVIERFHVVQMVNAVPSTSSSPRGHFIIDALDRGTSRLAQEAILRSENPALELSVTTLPQDSTRSGPTSVVEYAGRVWYAGFSGENVDGDSHSPRMSSYLLFSQLVRDQSNINLCYQEADPTSNIDSDVVETDGGFIKIDGAYGIRKLVVVRNSLFVMAENGVWIVSGADGGTFSATQYSVSKISNEGCVSAGSVVVAINSLTYWAESGIFAIQENEIGSWQTDSISRDTLQTLYDTFTPSQKRNCMGHYDSDNSSVRWIYPDDIGQSQEVPELIYNMKFSSFTKNAVKLPETLPGIIAVSNAQPLTGSLTFSVTVGGENVQAGGVDVFVRRAVLNRNTTEAYYLVVTGLTPLTYTFGRYNREDTTYDWTRLSLPTDSEAFFITGSVTGGDARLRKQIPYLTAYFEKVEDTSCILSSQWDWSFSSLSGKWSNPKQAYRTLRNKVDSSVVVTRNKMRGWGRSVAFKFSSEPGKPLNIYGWEFNLDATSEE